MTPHIEAKKGEIAKTVLMPGDPLRAKYIAENFLENVKQVNSVRNMLMFSGTYKGKEVSICGSGMGVPSIGIYSYELFKFYDVDTIIRVGSSGAYSEHLNIYDVVLVKEAYSDSTSFPKLVLGEDTHITYASQDINEKLKQSASKLGVKLFEERVHSTDVFYANRPLEETIKITQASCVEMESTGLFTNAKATGKNAACLLSISDHLITNEQTTSKQRETTFNDMIKVALESL
ncbi:purine-nucleoside phosphorylase [Sulfurospirillum sp. 1307]|jgi:purine-nucleoside phosphorylase